MNVTEFSRPMDALALILLTVAFCFVRASSMERGIKRYRRARENIPGENCFLCKLLPGWVYGPVWMVLSGLLVVASWMTIRSDALYWTALHYWLTFGALLGYVVSFLAWPLAADYVTDKDDDLNPGDVSMSSWAQIFDAVASLVFAGLLVVSSSLVVHRHGSAWHSLFPLISYCVVTAWHLIAVMQALVYHQYRVGKTPAGAEGTPLVGCEDDDDTYYAPGTARPAAPKSKSKKKGS